MDIKYGQELKGEVQALAVENFVLEANLSTEEMC